MIVLGRGIILVGDKNVPGGTVMTGSPTDTVFGRAIARIGDLVNCPLHGINKIIEGCPTFTAMGVPVALDGHVSECGCALVSSFRGGNSDGAASYGSSANALSSSDDRSASSHEFDQHFYLTDDSTGEALQNRLYRMHYSGGVVEGRTNDAGVTKTISAGAGEEVKIEIFAEGM
ncbi:MAG: PAAR domain-containing protein [Collimonas pratensis]|uniref:PAAR domain-containing protein n=1 Tax=Collimonas pratensis TaxID=279113 RepID=UPI003C741FEF